MGIGQVLTMPLFFASNAIYPLSIMPAWLRAVATLNPLTYLVDALRGLMVHDEPSMYSVGFDVGVLALVLIALLSVAVKIYPKLVQ
jgi:ABC-2 type transport system permease protein